MAKTYHMTINQDVKCKQCGKGGACKAEDGEFGLCLDCVNINLRSLSMENSEMEKTCEMVIAETSNLIEADWPRISNAYKNSDCALGVSVKIGLSGNLEVVEIVTELGYYPLPKTKIRTDPVVVDEKQIGLAFQAQDEAI